MFSSILARTAVKSAARRTLSTSSWQQSVWGKSNVRYVSFVVLGAVTIESVYGTVTNGIWESSNQGKLYKQINWSRFKAVEDDDDDE